MLLVSLLAATLIRESLAGTHLRYEETGAQVDVTLRPDGVREVTTTPKPRVLRRIETRGMLRVLREVDPESGRTLRQIPLYYNAKPARVFEANPVTALNDPTLRDQNDAAAAVPEAAYRVVDLPDLVEDGPLAGPHVRIVDLQEPDVAPADSSQPLFFDRGASGFEDVNAYLHIDRSQRRLQELGYTGPRAVVPYAIEVDTHGANGTDNSFFLASLSAEGKGTLIFGEGGTDDAEDPDLLIHEYAHAIHEWISPGTFLGARSSEARAISEGFGDYWTLSSTYEQALASGRDPFCVADWDARCAGDSSDQLCAYPAGADCLRRTDSTKTYADFVHSEESGTEHLNGEIWSSALRHLFLGLVQRYGLAEGRRVSDQIAIEAFFGTPPNPSFASMARRMIAADVYLSGGKHAELICAAMRARAILTDCATVPRGEVTWFQSAARGLMIPDNDASGVTTPVFVSDLRTIEQISVNVNITHAGRGELRITLIAPDGTEVRLQNTSGDRTSDIHTTFGRDTVPAQSLDILRGRSAAGEWKLRVSDVAAGDVGRLLSWSLVIQFAGDTPVTVRPSRTGAGQFIPIAGRAPGANGTFFMTDLRLLNRGSRAEEVTLIFTPSGADGRSNFAAVNVVAQPGEVIGLEDVVGSLFVSGGTGQLEIVGDIVVMSRTYTRTALGDFGLAAPPASEFVSLGEEPLLISQLESTFETRTNLGWAETAGHSGMLRLLLFDSITGALLSTTTYPVLPYSHAQIPIAGSGRMMAEVSIEEGQARVAAYGAVIDNVSGDPMLVPAMRPPDSAVVVAPAIEAPGAAGTRWRSVMAVTRGEDRSVEDPLVLHFTSEAGAETTLATPTPPVHQAAFFSGVLGRENVRGTAHSATARNLLFTSRIWTSGTSGTYGQFVPFRAPSRVPVQDLVFVESSPDYRTNIGAVAGPDGAELVVTVVDSAGNPVTFDQWTLPAYGFKQTQVTEAVTQGRGRIEVRSGAVYAYGSVVHNRTGDPFLVPAQ